MHRAQEGPSGDEERDGTAPMLIPSGIRPLSKGVRGVCCVPGQRGCEQTRRGLLACSNWRPVPGGMQEHPRTVHEEGGEGVPV